MEDRNNGQTQTPRTRNRDPEPSYAALCSEYRTWLKQPVRPPSDEELAGLELRHVELRRFRNIAADNGDPDLPAIEELLGLQARALRRLRKAHARRKKREARRERG